MQICQTGLLDRLSLPFYSMEASPVCNFSQLRRDQWSWLMCTENKLQELQALIVCYQTRKIIVKKEADYWVLPGRLYPRSEFPSPFKPFEVIPEVQELIASPLPLALLRQVWRRVKRLECVQYEKTVLLLECTEKQLSSSITSFHEHGYQWISVNKADIFHLEDEAEAILRKELKWVSKGACPTNRLRWQRPGWLASSSSWMLEQLQSVKGATLTEEIIHLRSSHLGTIVQAETTMGSFFLKCTPSVANDAAYTERLARIAPEFVMPPVAVDTENHIMITADYGEILAPDSLSGIETNRLTKDYAQLQIATIGKTEELIASGMPDLRLPKLLEHIDRLADSSTFQSLGNSEGSQADVEFFCENKELFKKEVRKLEATNLPSTVTHNDLTFSNIYKPKGKENYMFFDFVEGYVSHPFVLWLWSLNEKKYLHEWSPRSTATMDELPKLLYIGGTCYLLALIVLHMKEAKVAEFPESDEHYESARCSLRKFNSCFNQDGC